MAHLLAELTLAEESLSRVPRLMIAQIVFQMFGIGLPLLASASVLHILELLVRRRLATRFGWRSLLWTAWLGTPLHELSHAVMCVIFRHRIRAMALFQVDREAGRLGYVTHSYNPKSFYQVLGGFFIGTAPLVGGSLALYGLLWLFFPGAASIVHSAEGVGKPLIDAHYVEAVKVLVKQVGAILQAILAPEHVFSWRLWLFLYLVLCVGSHLAPSRSDYRGAARGAYLLLLIWLALNLGFAVVGGPPPVVVKPVSQMISPVFALLALSVTLCSIAALVVFLGTAPFRVRYRRHLRGG